MCIVRLLPNATQALPRSTLGPAEGTAGAGEIRAGSGTGQATGIAVLTLPLSIRLLLVGADARALLCLLVAQLFWVGTARALVHSRTLTCGAARITDLAYPGHGVQLIAAGTRLNAGAQVEHVGLGAVGAGNRLVHFLAPAAVQSRGAVVAGAV